MKQIIINILLKLLWNLTDDAIMSCEYLREEYNDVPEELKEVMFFRHTFHMYTQDDKEEKELRKKALAWLDEEEI